MRSKSDECRIKAIECIELATNVRNPEVKHIFRDLAYGWWRLAERTDQIAHDA